MASSSENNLKNWNENDANADISDINLKIGKSDPTYSNNLSVEKTRSNLTTEKKKYGKIQPHDDDAIHKIYQDRLTVGRNSGLETLLHNDHDKYSTTGAQKAKDSDKPYKEGILIKRNPGWFGCTTHERYFILENLKLQWYDKKPTTKQEREDTINGTIDFELIQMSIEKLPAPTRKNRGCCCCGWSKMEFFIKPQMLDRSFDLSVDPGSGKEEYLDWMNQIEKSCKLAEPVFVTHHPEPSTIPKNWWKLNLIHEPHFQEISQTGDILLFTTNNKIAQAQRLVTRGEYDHAAIMIRFTNNRLCFLEAMGNTGVTLVDWKEFVENQWHKLYSRMVTRRIDFDRVSNKMTPFFAWVKEVYGAPYSLEFAKLQQGYTKENRKSVTHVDVDGVEEQHSFFCSELVAKALKTLELLPEERASAQYWPSAFSEHNPSSNQKLEWTNEVKWVSHELDILFED